ncbi:MAG TPA: hypothetical protein VLY04_25290 [Bryobacteraceae bacterium]|nr:hypothetical protein [Bryobacteraceae bacterium]
MSTRRAHIILPEELLRQIDELVGVRGRSQFLVELARREVHRLRLLHFLEEDRAGWNLQEHPELNGGAAAWVDSLRQEDERIDSENLSR